MQIARYKTTNRLKAYSLAWKYIDLIYPPQCIICGKIGFRCCPECWEKRNLYSSHICKICGKPTTAGELCAQCKIEKPPLHIIRSLGKYTGVLQTFITALKYERNIGLAELILPDLTRVFNHTPFQTDMVIPVPLSKKRERERGYNQVAVWGRLFAMDIHQDFAPRALQRTYHTLSQVSLSAEKRWENVRGAFSANPEQIRGRNILLLDDVITTGATLYECAQTIYQCGANSVSALTIARSSIKKTLNKIGGSYV
ncbi:MAG TPA: hypothetical protein DCK95_01965 [Anaerolineaceae bacterium]|uniref:Putative phosphoribosyltransferase n=1 Tax=Anaerolinea thermophila TaxID=167964 RepID=A0A117LH79_9CHLR|nr:MAG: Putative phosphoribosyltransferase [Anaerolinea thermophila]HAF61072.1 hypothetical protein [Anaerolineaceae bacterium]